jgi:hypothetical protein
LTPKALKQLGVVREQRGRKLSFALDCYGMRALSSQYFHQHVEHKSDALQINKSAVKAEISRATSVIKGGFEQRRFANHPGLV